jgi:hypothetical protein
MPERSIDLVESISQLQSFHRVHVGERETTTNGARILGIGIDRVYSMQCGSLFHCCFGPSRFFLPNYSAFLSVCIVSTKWIIMGRRKTWLPHLDPNLLHSYRSYFLALFSLAVLCLVAWTNPHASSMCNLQPRLNDFVGWPGLHRLIELYPEKILDVCAAVPIESVVQIGELWLSLSSSQSEAASCHWAREGRCTDRGRSYPALLGSFFKHADTMVDI